MNQYEFLRKYSYNNLLDCENDKSNIHRHFFLPLDVDDKDDIEKIKQELNIIFPNSLIEFYKDIGIGQLYSKFRDNYKSRYRFLWSSEFLALYIEEYDEDEEFDGSRTNAIESLKENNRLSFMEASEHDFFEISLEDESIWIFGRKIANSLAEFIRKEFETPDYHYEDFQD